MEIFLSLRHINKTLHTTRTLRDVSLDFILGEVHYFAGQNGCGKPTLIKIISGVYRSDKGTRVTLGRKNWLELTPAASVVQGIQAAYQDPLLLPNLGTWENIVVNHYHHGLSINRRHLREVTQVAMIGINVTSPLDTLISESSIARCQPVVICRALAQDTRLIVMDEPTTSLIRQGVQGLLQVVYQLRGRGIHVVFVSHRLEEMAEVPDCIPVLKDGELVGTLPVVEMTTKQLGSSMAGQEFEYQARELWQGELNTPVLEMHNLSRHGEYLNISLWVEADGTVSIVGLLGAGYTELCLSPSGMTWPDAGGILINGQLVTLYNNQDAIRHGVGYASEDHISYDSVMAQSIEDNITSTVSHEVKDRFGFLNKAKVCGLVNGLIKVLTIKVSDLHLPVSTFSGGNAQRVSIAKWLAIGPRLLVLDNPAVGVGTADKVGIYGIISGLAAYGIAVLMICDEIEEA